MRATAIMIEATVHKKVASVDLALKRINKITAFLKQRILNLQSVQLLMVEKTQETTITKMISLIVQGIISNKFLAKFLDRKAKKNLLVLRTW